MHDTESMLAPTFEASKDTRHSNTYGYRFEPSNPDPAHRKLTSRPRGRLRIYDGHSGWWVGGATISTGSGSSTSASSECSDVQLPFVKSRDGKKVNRYSPAFKY